MRTSSQLARSQRRAVFGEPELEREGAEEDQREREVEPVEQPVVAGEDLAQRRTAGRSRASGREPGDRVPSRASHGSWRAPPRCVEVEKSEERAAIAWLARSHDSLRAPGSARRGGQARATPRAHPNPTKVSRTPMMKWSQMSWPPIGTRPNVVAEHQVDDVVQHVHREEAEQQASRHGQRSDGQPEDSDEQGCSSLSAACAASTACPARTLRSARRGPTRRPPVRASPAGRSSR